MKLSVSKRVGAFALTVVTFSFVSASALAGNGAPSGGHFNLNILGKSKSKSADLNCGDGRRIFVPLAGNAKINLAEGPFAVLDCNGTDGSAQFQLPSPDADGDGVTSYSVYVRALGKPGGSAKMTTCAKLLNEETGLLEDVCSLASVSVKRTAGKQTFTNVSKELLYVDIDIDGDGDIDHIPLFDDRLEGYLWSYDNDNLKLLQMRFYEIPTNTN
jgi:hypothetical protein